MKKALSVILSIAMILTMLAGCAGNVASSGVTSSNKSDKKLKIFFTSAFMTSPYAAPMNKSMEEYAKANNIDLQIVDGDGNSQKQLDQIKNAVTQKVDGIIYWPADQVSTIPVVRYLADSKVPFVVVNSKVDPSVQNLVKAYVGLDYAYSAGIGGQICLDTLGAKGGNVVVVEGAAGTEVAINYEKGFEDKIASNSNIKIIAKQNADWDTAKAMKVMEDYLTTFGDKIDFIYSHDDGMYQGIASALSDAKLNGKIPVVCNGQSQFVLDAIKAGNLLGSASQDPRDEGTTSIKILVKVIKGEQVPEWTKDDCQPITKGNADKFQGY